MTPLRVFDHWLTGTGETVVIRSINHPPLPEPPYILTPDRRRVEVAALVRCVWSPLKGWKA